MFDVSVPFLYAAGISSGTTKRVLMMGHNPDVDTTTQPEDIWAGAALGTLNGIDHRYVQRPASAVSMEVVSDSASDAAAGAGMRTALVIYLDSLYREKTTVVTLNGLTPVAMPESVLRINAFQAATSGSPTGNTPNNVGNVSIRATGGLGATYSYMEAGTGIARTSLYTTPLGLECDIISITAALGRIDTADRWATYNVCYVPFGGALIKGTQLSVSTSQPYRHETTGLPLLAMAEKSDFWVRCEEVNANNADVTCSVVGVQRRPVNFTL